MSTLYDKTGLTEDQASEVIPALLAALENIAQGAPAEDPSDTDDYDDMEGAYGAGLDQQHYQSAQIARAALAKVPRR